MFDVYTIQIKEFLSSVFGSRFNDSIIVKDPASLTSDVDICINQKGYYRILRSLSEESVDSCVFLYEINVNKISVSVKLLFYENGDNITDLKLDIRTYIGKWPHQILFDFKRAYKFTESRDGFIVLNDTCRYLYLFAHLLFDKPLKDKYLKIISDHSILIDKLEDCREDVLLTPVNIFSRRLFKKQIEPLSVLEKLKCYRFYFSNLPSIFVKMLEYRRALIIQTTKLFAFCGCDGAGKTTLVENISKIFSSNNLLTKCYHFNRSLGLINYKKSMGDRMEIAIESGQTYFIRRNATYIENSFRFLSALDRYLGIVSKIVFPDKTRIILLDRYIIDYFLRDRIVNVKYSGIVRRCMLRLFPKPSILFYIYASPQEIFKRKQEYANIRQIDREIRLYTRYIKLLKEPNIVFIKNHNVNKSTHSIIKEILNNHSNYIKSIIRNKLLIKPNI